MHNRFKKLVVCALVVTMLIPLGTLSAFSQDEDTAEQTTDTTDTAADANDEDEESESDSDELPEKITDAQAAAACETAFDNENFTLIYNEEDDRVGLYVKATGKYWWTTPINAEADDAIADEKKGDTMSSNRRARLSSNLIVEYKKMDDNGSSTEINSKKKGKVTYKIKGDQLIATYTFRTQGFTIPVVYELDETGLTASVATEDIVEKKPSMVDGYRLLSITLLPYFGAAPTVDENGTAVEGYMVVPDGSGAVIEYNNGKGNYQPYIQTVYGRDYTPVPNSAPAMTEQAYLPLTATVSGNDGLVNIITEGDSFATLEAQVAGYDGQTYNSVFTTFEMRSQDKYFLTGSDGLTVIEKGDIKTDKIAVKYCPITNEDGVNVADVAQVYRDYLVSEKGLTKTTDADTTSLYLDLYGGVLKQQSVLGIPFDLKTEMTTFDQAGTIIDSLQGSGVTDLVVNYNDWTNKSIKNEISTKAKGAGVLGGNSDFEDLLNEYKDSGVTIYPSMDNLQMDSSSFGYFTFTSTAIRISNAYSRQTEFSLNYREGLAGVAAALLSPTKYSKVFSQMIDSYTDKDLTTVGFGSYSSVLSSDFSKKHSSSRDETMQAVIDGYKEAKASIGSVLADSANAYVLPYVDHVVNAPLYSSNFDIVDYDVPLYQMVLHGYVPYATKAINASANSSELFMLALASGSNLHYDMIYADAFETYDTDYNQYFYANYKGWITEAAAEYGAAKEILSKVSGMEITRYETDDATGVITTTYASDDGKTVTTQVDMTNQKVTVDGVVYDMSSIIGEGGLQG